MKNNLVVGNNYADFTKGSNTGTVVSSNNLSSDSTAEIVGLTTSQERPFQDNSCPH